MLRKKLEQLLKIFIVICTVFSSFTLIKPVEVSAATDDTLTNVALNKAVTVSGTETDTMVGSYITDGLVPANLADSTDPNYTKRWSSNATLNETPVWAFIDLGEVTKIDKVKIYWQKADGTNYDIQISNTATNDSWVTIKNVTAPVDQNPRFDDITLDTVVEARYVRIYIKEGIVSVREDVKTASIYEVEIFSPNTVEVEYENVSINKAVTVSGTETDTMVGSYITDGLKPEDLANTNDSNYKKRWSSNAALDQTPVWAYIDLEEEKSIEKINVYWQKANASEYQIQISDDASEWTPVKTIVNTVAQGPRVDNITLDSEVETRYVRLYITAGSGLPNVGIYEVEIFARKDTSVKENLALNKDVYSNGNETTNFTPNLTTDGLKPADMTKHDPTDPNYTSRWSSLATLNTTPVWLYVDLEETKNIEEVYVYWQKANASEYEIQISNTGTDTSWKTIKTVTNEVQSITPRLDKIVLDEEVAARYVRIYATKNNGEHNNVGIFELEIYGTRYSKTNDNLALSKEAYSNGNETINFTPNLTTDGLKPADMTKHDTTDPNYTSRWSSLTTLNTTPVWLYVDLGEAKNIAQVNVYWQKANASEYQIQISDNANDWITVKTITNEVQSTAPRLDQNVLDNIEKARYVRIYATKNNGEHANVGIFELEVYSNIVYQEPEIPEKTEEEIVQELVNNATVSIGNGKLILPTYEGYTFSLYGSNNKQVIDLNGNIIPPLVDMKVNVILQAKKDNGEGNAIVSNVNIEVTVPGQYQVTSDDNAKPDVMPALREWKGYTGNLELSDNTKIIYNDSSVEETATLIQGYFDEMLDKDLTIGTEASNGDIELVLDENRTELGDEGYFVEIDDTIKITAPTKIGLLYGGISITQILYQDNGMNSIPKGLIRDYPMYEVRACMLDVGRMYFPLEYVQEIATYMSWYKLNELHLGTNNSRIQTGYTAFRLDTDNYPELVSTDGYYEKQDYKKFQQEIDKFGINIITEIDTPAHSGRFAEIDDGKLMMDFNHLDLRTPEKYEAAITVVKNIIDEYLGESINDPDRIIQENVFHIGTDEYPTSYTAQFKNYTADLINYVTSKGYEVRLWGSLKDFSNPDNPIHAENATMNQWSQNWATAKASMDHGFNLINTLYNYLYIVPGLKGYPEFLPLETRYNSWDVTNYGNEKLLKGEAKNLGAEFCVWMDTSSYNGGFSWFDAFDRFKNGVMLISEKTWYGEKTEDQTTENFLDRVEKLGNKTPYANPGRLVDSEGEKVLSYDFETYENNTVIDSTLNKYDGTLVNSAIISTNKSQVLALDGNSYLQLPIDSIGHPYTIVFDILINEDCPADAELLTSEDGTLYVNMNGNIGFKREYSEFTGYSFEFDYQLPKEEWTNLAITCDGTNTYLIVNGKDTYTAINKHSNITVDSTKIREIDSTTFVAGLSKIGNKLKGSIDNLVVLNEFKTAETLPDAYNKNIIANSNNLAYLKDATANHVEINTSFIPKYVTDGLKPAQPDVHDTSDPNYAYRWSSSNIETKGAAELVIDLGNVTKFDKVDIYWQKANGSVYEIQISNTGEDDSWETIKEFNDPNRAANPILDSHLFDKLVEGRFVKIYITKANGATTYNNVGIFEVEIFRTEDENKILTDEALEYLEEVKTLLDETPEGSVLNNAYTELENALEEIENLIESEDKLSIAKYWSTLESKVDYFKNNIKEVNFEELKNLIAEVNNKDYSDYTDETVKVLKDLVNEAEELISDTKTTQLQVDEKVESITDAISALVYKPADYSKVNEAIEAANALDKDLYKDFSAVEKAIKEVEAGKNITEQEVVDGYAKAIEDAISALEYKEADYSAVEKAKEKVPEDLSVYTEESVKALNDALAGVEDGKNITEQEEVDAMAKAIENAINGLVKKDTGNSDKPTDSDSDKPEGPSTSDNYHVAVFTGLLILSAGVLVLMLIKRKREAK